MSSPRSSKNAEEEEETSKTKVFYGADNVINTELEFFYNSKNNKIDTCMNYTRPQLAIEIESIKKAFIDAKSRGVRLRYLTDIRAENISFCKELASIVDELRHLDGIKGSFMISESEYLAPLVLFEKAKVASQIIYSNVAEIVEQQQYVFDTLWNKALPAQEKIREIEEGIIPIRTRLLENQDEIIREIKRLNNAANKLSICTSFGGMQMSYNYLFDSYKNVIDKYKKGESKEGLRWLTNIDNKETANLVKIFLQSGGMQVRHVKNMPPLNFGVSDKEVALTIEKMVGGSMSRSFVISNEPLYVKHFNSLFDELWKNGIDATYRIKEIEEETEPEFVEVVTDREKASQLLVDLAKSLKKEALSLMANAKGMLRMDKLGIIDDLIKASQNGAIVKIICPLNEENSHIVAKISKKAPDIRIMNSYTDAPSGILIADGSRFLQAEVKNPIVDQFSEAIGFAIYSNSKHNVNSFKSFFELLWNQHATNEELRRIDKMQKEFIDIAAHELRTPIQPIIGLTEVVYSKTKDTEQRQLLDAVIRNSKRLGRLTEDILDVARIESQKLKLNKERFNINEKIRSVVNDIRSKEEDEIEITVAEPKVDPIIVKADKVRIYEVISNLLSNAIKFTKKKGTSSNIYRIGTNNINKNTITISTTIVKSHQHEEDKNDDDNNKVIISIKDMGTGIDSDIQDRLFTKFATKSDTGSGLGLFISKNIIEAHGGKIWAENNTDGRGATFSFTLPIEAR